MHGHIDFFLILLSLLQLVEKDAHRILQIELERFRKIVSPHLSHSSESAKQEKENLRTKDKKEDNSATDGALKITLHVLKEKGHNELAIKLEKRKNKE